MKQSFLTFVAAGVLMASCSIYHPQAVDIPLIGAEGEWRVDASAGVSTVTMVPDAMHIGATATCGISPWMSGQLHVNYGGENNFYLQAAPGAYHRIGSKAVVELYAGLGYGGAGSESKQDDGTGIVYSGTFALPFLQANFGWRDLGIFEIGMGVKVGSLVPWFQRHYFDAGQEIASRFRAYYTPNGLIEPQLQLGIGSQKVKFVLRVGATWLSDISAGDDSGFSYDWLTLSTGLNFRF